MDISVTRFYFVFLLRRFVPFWNRIIKPTLEMNNDVLIVAGKNIQRALLKVVYNITGMRL